MSDFGGVFEVLASDAQDVRLASRKALLLAEGRVDKRFSKWLAARSVDEFDAKFAYVADDFKGIVAQACEECGHAKPESIEQTLHAHLRNQSGKPPWLKDDDDDDDDSEEVEDKARQVQKAEDKGHLWDADDPESEMDDEHKASLAAVSQFTMTMAANIVTPIPEEQGATSSDRVSASPKGDSAEKGEQVPCPQCGGDGTGNSGKKCARCEGKGKVSDWGPSTLDALESKTADKGNTDLGGPSPKMDKAKWTPQNVKKYKEESDRWPSVEKDAIEPIKGLNADPLKEIGEKTTESEDLPTATNDSDAGFASGGESKGPSTKTFPDKNQTDPVTNKSLEASFLAPKTAEGGGPSYPPQAEIPGQTPAATPYNPAIQEEMMGDMHPAAKYAYDRAIQQGVHPQEAQQQAQEMQQQMMQRATQGQGVQNMQIPVGMTAGHEAAYPDDGAPEAEQDGWGDDPGIPPICPTCGGEGNYLGRLGRREHFRCRQCGMDFSSENDETRPGHFGSENPIVDLIKSHYEGFVPVSTIKRVASALSS